jgi:putative RNA 2'-phosphotransferase
MNDRSRATTLSKWLSYTLRHDPAAAGITLDRAGWVAVDALLAAAARAGHAMSRPELEAVVAGSDKQRFALSTDGARIRANQGHSVPVELGLAPQAPPAVLWHGTAKRFLTDILREGLKPQDRHHVHLSTDAKATLAVGGRHGSPQLLRIDAARMHADGHVFFVTANGVWLVDAVPPTYLSEGSA